MKSQSYPYFVVMTGYHHGGIASRHKTLSAAESAAAKIRGPQTGYGNPTCVCGCAHVVRADEYDELPYADEPGTVYAPCRT